MRKRWLAFLLACVMLVGLLPMDALAYVGPVITSDDEKTAVRVSRDGSLLTLQNDYITFCVSTAVRDGALSTRTAPTRECRTQGSDKALDAGFAKRSYKQNNSQLKIASISGAVSDSDGTYTINGSDVNIPKKHVALTITFTNNQTLREFFWLERVESTDKLADDGKGQNWAVFSRGVLSAGEWCSADMGNQVFEETEYNFSRMGHSNSQKLPTVFLRRKDGESTLNISTGLARTKTVDTYNEVYTDCYASANPFVALSEDYHFYSGGVSGPGFDDPWLDGYQNWFFPENVSYTGEGKLTTYKEGGLELYSCWGYRNLFTEDDTSEAATKPDNVTITSGGVWWESIGL